MKALLRLFGSICRFKQGPEDIPASISLFTVILMGNFLVEIILGLTVYTIELSIILTVLSFLTLFFLTWFYLFIFQFSHRLLQTATAFVGISLFTNVFCFIPVILLWKVEILPSEYFAMINLALIIYVLLLYAQVFKSALNVSVFLGFALSITYFIIFNTLSFYITGV